MIEAGNSGNVSIGSGLDRGPLLETSPLFASAWTTGQLLSASCSTSARYQLLARARAASDLTVLAGLQRHLAEQDDPAPRTAAECLRIALECASFGTRSVVDYLQAAISYASFSETLRAGIPTCSAPDSPGDAEAWQMDGADRLAATLVTLDYSPVRQLLNFLRQAEDAVEDAERGWRLALLLPLAAAAAARGVKEKSDTRPARLKLLELARWAAEEGSASPGALEHQIIPVVQAVAAYHAYRRERRTRFQFQKDLPSREDYLRSGYFEEGVPRPGLFREWADEWASQLEQDDTTASQFRRIFHELRRLETLARQRPWEHVQTQIFALAPLAADAAARSMKEGREIRALAQLVYLNLAHLRSLGTAVAQREAFLGGTVPHLEAVLARFNSTKLRELRSAPSPLPESAADRERRARRDAELLLNYEVSHALVRRVYGEMSRTSRCRASHFAAQRERAITLAEEAVRRAAGKKEGQRLLLGIIRQSALFSSEQMRAVYVPYLQSVVEWLTGLPALKEAGVLQPRE